MDDVILALLFMEEFQCLKQYLKLICLGDIMEVEHIVKIWTLYFIFCMVLDLDQQLGDLNECN